MVSLKAKTICFACLLAVPPSLLGQLFSEVYKTLEDYKDQKMVYAIDCSKEKHKIKSNDFSKKPFITLIHDGIAARFPKTAFSTTNSATANSSGLRITGTTSSWRREIYGFITDSDKIS